MDNAKNEFSDLQSQPKGYLEGNNILSEERRILSWQLLDVIVRFFLVVQNSELLLVLHCCVVQELTTAGRNRRSRHVMKERCFNNNLLSV
jgi:hypothetical protein